MLCTINVCDETKNAHGFGDLGAMRQIRRRSISVVDIYEEGIAISTATFITHERNEEKERTTS